MVWYTGQLLTDPTAFIIRLLILIPSAVLSIIYRTVRNKSVAISLTKNPHYTIEFQCGFTAPEESCNQRRPKDLCWPVPGFESRLKHRLHSLNPFMVFLSLSDRMTFKYAKIVSYPAVSSPQNLIIFSL